MLDTARKLARSPHITTLIEGENGTGKGEIARFIHNNSLNANKPYVDINCGAIPESLLESELFGHEKGAFTGAQSQKKGLFEQADGGTIFLDEIGNTSLGFQSKLLKVVENKTFRHVGGIQEIVVNCRIIAATNVDLKKAVKEKTFREDLYYRLNIGRLFLPPLRKRKEDILILADHFLQTCNNEYGREIKGIAPDAREAMLNYDWPGNIRQLKNSIERAVLIESEEWITRADLNLDHGPQNHPTRHFGEVNGNGTPPKLKDLERYHFPTQGIPLEELERGIISSALKKADGNLSHAARLLKITRGKLRYRMQKLGIEEPGPSV